MGNKLIISEDELYNLYIIQNLSITEIGNIFNVSEATIYNRIKKYGIKKSLEKSKEKRRQTNLEKYGCENPFQSDEIKEKIKQTNLEKYGCESPAQSKEIQEKIKQTNLEKYGCESPFQSDEIQEKIKQTNLEKYGCENPFQSDEIKEKIKKTMLEKYGCEHISQSERIKEKKKQTTLEKYGCEHISQVQEIRDKIKQTNINKYDHENISQANSIKEKKKQIFLEKYGCENPFQSDEIKEKIKKTMLEKYGCEHPAQSKEIQEKIKNKYYPNISKYLSSKEVAKKFVFDKYSGKTTVSQFAKDTNISYTTCIQNIHKYNLEEYFDFNSQSSQPENDIIEYLESKGIKNIIRNDRNILDGKEIDIYLPDYKVGIEFNGDYWHSELMKEDKYYHYNKSVIAINKGIFLYHIFSHEWADEEKRIRILNHLCNILQLNENKIYARKCIIKEVSVSEKNIFLNENHIQGKDNSSIKLGLYYNGILVSLMTFCKPRFSKKYTWELSRFCSMHGYNVIGGASKLFKYFVNNYMKQCETIVSYSDIAKTQGRIYQTLNFDFIDDAAPNYIWWKSDNDYKTRYQCQMKDEKEIMRSQGYAKVYDCGNKVWIYKKETRN